MMSFPRTRAITALGAALLSALSAAAAQRLHHAAAPAGIPSRPLLGEMSKAEVGAAATVHSASGSGPGMVLASSHQVLASLHLVLDGRKQPESGISVDITMPPHRPVLHVPASIIAQDPADDLVLLELKEALPSAPPAPPPAALPPLIAAAAAAPPPPADTRASAPPAQPAARVAAAPRGRFTRHRMGSPGVPVPVAQSETPVVVDPVEAPPATATAESSERSFYVADAAPRRSKRHTSRRHAGVTVPLKPPPQEKVVYDGPATPTKVVEDGPATQ